MTTQQDLPAGTDAQVAITLDSCCKEDAHAVLAALHASFPSDRSPEDVPAEPQGGPPIIWTATFDVSRTLGLARPGRLTEPVVITAQGGYHAVDRLREALTEAFSVRVVGTSAGDQEEEVRLRLESPAAA
ncbi:hypothetical protein [Actinacidiphila acidipaludis]|uniref:Uncharacterized protein n=1 Tax=Actinacidiphila acidipaludis TaxID=2873382 RepID=A0ABS7Q8E1_9ACTN|nr:hypothetical protein [Streptomyces acidipaludis]MBY8879429.1 hypothetical protein [Streptomyces acidipaludis]